MTTKHTPGPWGIVEPSANYASRLIKADSVGKGYYGFIATATSRDPHPVHGGGISEATAQANARLIAAAPDMLNMLKRILETVEMGESFADNAFYCGEVQILRCLIQSIES